MPNDERLRLGHPDPNVPAEFDSIGDWIRAMQMQFMQGVPPTPENMNRARQRAEIVISELPPIAQGEPAVQAAVASDAVPQGDHPSSPATPIRPQQVAQGPVVGGLPASTPMFNGTAPAAPTTLETPTDTGIDPILAALIGGSGGAAAGYVFGSRGRRPAPNKPQPTEQPPEEKPKQLTSGEARTRNRPSAAPKPAPLPEPTQPPSQITTMRAAPVQPSPPPNAYGENTAGALRRSPSDTVPIKPAGPGTPGPQYNQFTDPGPIDNRLDTSSIAPGEGRVAIPGAKGVTVANDIAERQGLEEALTPADRVASIPTLTDIVGTIPLDKNGSPDMETLQMIIQARFHADAFNKLNGMQKAQLLELVQNPNVWAAAQARSTGQAARGAAGRALREAF